MKILTEDALLEMAITKIARHQVHKDYNRTVKTAAYWKSIVTGTGQEAIILKKRQSNSSTQKAETIKLYNTHTPYLSNRIKSIFEEVDRTDRVNKILEIKEDEKDNINPETWTSFSDQLKNVNATLSLDQFLNTKLYNYSATDPNALLLLNFFPFDNATEYPTCYSLVIPSSAIIDRYMDLNGLSMFMFRKRINEVEFEDNTTQVVKALNQGKKPKQDIEIDWSENFKYYIYTKENAYECLESQTVEKHKIDVSDFNMVNVSVGEGKPVKRIFYRTTNHKTGYVPAKYLGYTYDLENDYKTFESHLRPAKEVFNEHCEKKSKLDNQMALFGFVRALFYVDRCNYLNEHGEVCSNGSIGGNVCPKCEGSGLAERRSRIAKNEFEITEVEIPLPNRATNEDLIDLSRLSHYVEIPENVLSLYESQADKLAMLTSLALFNTNVFDQSELNIQTATGVRQFAKSVNNVIYKYAEHRANVWTFIVKTIAKFYGIKDQINYNLKYDSDFKLETEGENITKIQSAKSAGVCMEYIRSIENDLMSKRYKDNPEELLWHITKMNWKPFYNKGENEVLSALAYLKSDDSKKVLWLFFEDIFKDIRNAVDLPIESDIRNFVELSYLEQKQVLDVYINQYKERLKEEEASADFPQIPFDA